MSDLYITEDGDLAISTSGDIAMTDSIWRDDVQQAYVRIMTDPGDFLLYRDLGAGLSRLYGMPQTPATGQIGANLIQSALDREGRFRGKPIQITPVPISHQSIRFDVAITSGAREQIKLSVEQNLGVQ
jgi:phage baseplate assembly protein W